MEYVIGALNSSLDEPKVLGVKPARFLPKDGLPLCLEREAADD